MEISNWWEIVWYVSTEYVRTIDFEISMKSHLFYMSIWALINWRKKTKKNISDYNDQKLRSLAIRLKSSTVSLLGFCFYSYGLGGGSVFA